MNINRREMLGLTAGLLSTMMVPTWAKASNSSNGKRIVRVAASGLTINGTLATLREQSNVGRRILPSILEPVIATDVLGDLSLEPGIAESWTRINDRVLEVKLREGLIFHNGDELTAEDVAFSFSPQVMFGGTQPNRGEGAETIKADDHAITKTTGTQCPPEVAAVGRRLWPSLEEVKVIDKYTVQFINAVPDPTLEGRLTRMGCDVISKRHYLESGDWHTWAAAPVGTGPFKVKEHRPTSI